MKNKRTKRALAFFMSVIITLATFASDASLVTTHATGTGDSLTASTTTSEGLKITKAAVVDGEDVTLTFTVDGADGTKITQTTSETAVVFVMDISNSMKDRLSTAKKAAEEFATGLLKNDKVSVGVVSYGTYAYEEQALSKNADDITKKINKISIEGNKDKKDWNLGGTNLQAGIYYAEDMLKKSAAAKKIIVVLSDGEPTFNYKVTGISKDGFKANDGNDVYPYTFDYTKTENTGTQQTYEGKITYKCTVTDVKSQRYPWGIMYTVSYEDEFGKTGTETVYGDSKYKKGYEFYKTKTKTLDSGIAAISEAKLAKDAGIDIYSIAYDVAEGSSARSVMFNVANKNDSSNTYYYAATSNAGTDVSNAIGAVLKSIQTSIEEKVNGAMGTRLVDELPTYMSLDAADSVNAESISANDVSMSDNSLTWDLGDLGSTDKKTVTVKAKLDISTMIEAYATENNMTAADVREKMSNGSIVFNLNKLVTLSYKDKNGKDQKNTDISVDEENGTSNVPKTAVYTYPYTIKYTVDGEASDAYPEVTGYGYKGEEIDINLYAASEAISDTKEIKRGDEILTPENGELSFKVQEDSEGAANVITVALHSATHKVTFMVDGQKYVEQDVPYGEAADAPKNPEKTGYTFNGWDKSFSNITTDTVVNAQFTINKYNVTFNVYKDGSLDAAQSASYTDIEYGQKVNVPGVTLPEETAEFSYSGSGWKTSDNNDVTGNEITVTESATYTYNINKETRKYTVNYYFEAADGKETLIESREMFYGEALGTAPDYSKSKTPENAESVYEYSGWYTLNDGIEVEYNPEDTVTGTTNVYVRETASAHPYTITYKFISCEGNETQESKPVKYGEGTPDYPATLYTEKQNDAQYTYSYTLDKLADKVTGDATYYVRETRTVNTYEVTLQVNDDGDVTTIKKGIFEYGTVLSDIKNYTAKGKEGYTAKEINWAWDDTYTVGGAATLTTNIEYDINKYSVNFVYELFDADSNTTVSSNELKSITVNHGKTLEDSYPDVTQTPDDDQYTYTLGDWNVDEKKEITGSTTVTIRETRVTKSYDVTFVVNYVEADGETPYAETETKTVSVKYGTAATAPITLPTADGLKEAQANKYEYNYTVSGWDKDFTNITGETTVTATVTREKIKYNVTFKIEGKEDKTFTGVYGYVIDVPTIPEKAADDTYTYTIKKNSWPEGSSYTITGNATFEASYTADYINYAITFIATNDFDTTGDKVNKTVGEKSDVHYNDVVKTLDIVKDTAYRNWFTDDEKYDYKLKDFDESYTVTSKSTIASATWSRTPVNHTITYVIDDVSFNDTFAYGTKVTIKENPDKTGYEFTGWTWTKASDKSSLLAAPTTMPEYDLVATANFEAKTYTVKVNYMEEGTENTVSEPVEKEVRFDGSYAITSPEVKHFTVKTDDAVKTGTFDAAALSQAVNGVLTLNAYYTRDSYIVRFFDCNSSSTPIKEETVKYEGSATAPAEFAVPTSTVNGENARVFWFDGWDTTFANVSKDIDVNAKYASENFNIKPSVSDNDASTIVGTDVSGNLLDNDTDKVEFKAKDYSDDTADIKVSADGTFEVKAKAAGIKTVTVPYTYSKTCTNEHGTWVLTYEGSESLEITVYEPSTLTLSNKTVKYDGKEQKLDFNAEGFKNVTYTYGETKADEMPTFTDAGDYTVIVNADYEKDGKTYAAAPVSATLTIQKRNVVLTSASDTKTYDGKALTNTDVKVTGDGFASGEGATYSVRGAQTNAGASENTFTYTLDTNTKATNYDVSANNGTLKVEKRTIELVSASGDKVYDGTPLEIKTVDASGNDFAEGEGVTFDVTGSITNVSDNNANNNIFTYTFNPGTDKANYEITVTYGTLTILPVRDEVTVNVRANSGSAVYDGTSHTVSGYEFVNATNTLYTEDCIKFTGADLTYVNAGTYAYDLNEADFANTSANFANVKFNIEDGMLSISRRPVTVTVNNASKNVGDPDPALSASVSNTVLGDTITVWPWRYAGNEAAGSYTIYATIDGDYPNYDISVVNGTFTINGTTIVIPETPTPTTPAAATPVVTPVAPTPVEPETEETEAVEPTAVENVEEETPLASTPSEVEIEEEPVPEVAPSHCVLHWIILLISLVYAAYAVLRAMQNKRELDDINETNETNEAANN